MSITCECGQTLNLPNVAATKCGIDFGQIQAMAFVKISDMPTVGSGSTTDFRLRTNLCDKSVWVAALTESTPKVTVSPELFNVSTNAGDETTWEGNDGIEEHVDTNPSEITAELRRCTPAQAKALQEMRCLAQGRDLGVYLFDGNGVVMGQDCQVSASGDGLQPIEVRSIFVSDRSFMGRSEPDYYALSVKLEGEYSLDLGYENLDKNGSADLEWRGVDLIGQQTA